MFHLFRSHGILGLNARNLLYVKPFNPKKAVAFADDKLKTKAFLSARGVPVSKIYAKLETREHVRLFDFSSLPDECVLKPNRGFGGEGIIVLKGRKKGVFMEQGKHPVTEIELRAHMEDIIDGRFSMGGVRDIAFFEEILHANSCFAPFRPVGLPDIRIVVFNLVPVMAMVRIGSAASHGKGNVHLGAIGVGIDIAKGVTTHAVQYHKIIEELPHGGSPMGHKIPYWDDILNISSHIQYITNIGYLATDITIDEHRGPVLLEVNARAGLMVQVANKAPLHSRLKRVEGLKVSSPEKGVRIGQDLFGEKLKGREKKEDRVQPVLGTREVIQISGVGATVDVPCLIAPQEERSMFTHDLITELKAKSAVEESEKGYKVKFSLAGKKIQTLVQEGEVPVPTVRAVIGKRELAGFLIDPTKEAQDSLIGASVREDLRAVDKILADIDRDVQVLKYIKPINIREERTRSERDRYYNPVFSYPEIPFNLDEVQKRLENISCDGSPLGVLLEKKRRELLMRVDLLRARGNEVSCTSASLSLYGAPSASLISQAKAVIAARTACALPPGTKELKSAEEAAPIFEQALEKYGLHDWVVSVRSRLVADCSVGGKSVYIRQGAEFSKEHINALIAHEIETHAVTAENGDHQPFRIFRRGFAGYLDTQEGLAVRSQNRVLSDHHDKRFGPARNVLAVTFALEHSFVDTRIYLEEELGYRPQKALTKTIDLKRGLRDTSQPGAFTKGLVYFRGERAVEDFVLTGGDLKRLYIGKVALEDIELIEKIPDVNSPLIIPEHLRQKKEENVRGRKT